MCEPSGSTEKVDILDTYGRRGPVLWGWRWVGTDKAWPFILGDPPAIPGVKWEAIYR
jgi:hypothetical protein